eukprot:12883923-Prorocentrum_lima.AAC.1
MHGGLRTQECPSLAAPIGCPGSSACPSIATRRNTSVARAAASKEDRVPWGRVRPVHIFTGGEWAGG